MRLPLDPASSDQPSAVARLRAGTRDAHDTVDAAYARFDLTDVGQYRAFLAAHTRALPTAEGWAAQVYPLRRRTPLLARDLAVLGVAQPEGSANVVAPPGAWGALYVVEGSRLGGQLLARSVGAGLPTTYLAAAHLPGEWRAIRAAIDAAGAGQGEDWHRAALAGAQATFDLYRDAAV